MPFIGKRIWLDWCAKSKLYTIKDAMKPNKKMLFFLLFPLLFLSSCAEIVVKEVGYAEGPIIPEEAAPAPIMFNNIRFLLPPGTEIGLESGMGPALLGGFCSWQNYPVNRRVLSRKFEKQYIEAAFEEALEAQGYDVTNDIDADYRREDLLSRAEYMISARVSDVDLDLCKRGEITTLNIFNSAPGAKGKMYVKFDWSVYDALRRTVVYKTTTEGYSRRDYPNTEGLELLFMDSFDMAAHNLGADEDFYNLIVKGIKPPQKEKRIFGKPERTARSRKFDPMEKVVVENPRLRTESFQRVAEEKRHAVVTIQKLGHGSGFFITKEGHILTNQHVVGDSERIRVILADKEDAVTAEVLRADKMRDVALLRLTELPKGYDIQTLPIRTDWPVVSEDVYAIGTPQHYSILDNTITKGIVSAHRTDVKFENLRLNFIQADVTVHGGNSGGPLLDGNGNIVGISALGLYPIDQKGIELNLFIPIGEALEALDIRLAGDSMKNKNWKPQEVHPIITDEPAPDPESE